MAAPAVKMETARPEKPAPAAEVPKKKSDFIGIVVLILVAVDLAALGAMGYFLNKMWLKIQELQTLALKVPVPDEKDEKPMGKELTQRNIGVLMPLESFLVNLPSDQGPKFLQTQMELELADPAVEEEISRKKPMIRDAILMLLSSRTYQELRNPNGMSKLRQDLLRAVNNILTTGRVKELYFTQFHFN